MFLYFFKKIKKLSLLFLLIASPIFAEVWLHDINKAIYIAKRDKKPLLLDFYTVWCGFCRKLQTQVYPKEIVRVETNKFVLVRIDGEKRPDLMQAYGVSSFPTIIALDYQGTEIERVNGLLNHIELSNRLKLAAQNARYSENLLEKLNQNPQTIDSLYETGARFFQAKNYRQAEQLFYRAWSLYKDKKEYPLNSLSLKEKKINQCLYNASICSMHQENYKKAVRMWDMYIKRTKVSYREYKYARYYRGISYFYMGNKIKAKEDLKYSSDYLPDSELRANAKSLLGVL